MNKVMAIIKIALKRTFEQRTNILVANLQSAFTLFVIYYFWKAVYANSSSIKGYTFEEIVTYYFITRVTYNRISAFTVVSTAKLIKSGELTRFLLKPINFIKYSIIENTVLGDLWSLGNLISILILSSFLYGSLRPPASIAHMGLFLLVFLINGFLSKSINILIGLVGFWTTEVAHLKLVTTQTINIVSGGLIPLAFFPEKVQKVLNFLPFKYLIQFPIDVYLGKLPMNIVFINLGILVLWCTILLSLTMAVFKKGLKGYESFN